MKALVTGGSSGLGYHIARELKDKGYELILISRNGERLKRAASSLGAEYHTIDLSRDYRRAGEIVKEEKPHILVNNAGFGLYGEFSSQSWEDLERMLLLNVVALTHLTHSFFEVRDSGYVLNISSVAACRAQRKLSTYAGTKAYVEHFSRSLSKERADIVISYLLLGPTRTNFFKNSGMPTKGLERIMLSPEKVARYAVDKMLRGKRRITPGLLYKLYCLGK